MLPANVREFLITLRTRTEKGEITWSYNDDDATVRLDQPEYTLTMSYSFNQIEEVGQFRIVYFEKSSGIEHFFSTNQLYKDYDTARILYDYAQASRIKFK